MHTITKTPLKTPLFWNNLTALNPGELSIYNYIEKSPKHGYTFKCPFCRKEIKYSTSADKDIFENTCLFELNSHKSIDYINFYANLGLKLLLKNIKL